MTERADQPRRRANRREVEPMGRSTCILCGYNYDPESGEPRCAIAAGTLFEDLPEDFRCPRCGASKSDFVSIPEVTAARKHGGDD